jgi:riboflavin kinase/FMN adenylyltransferase
LLVENKLNEAATLLGFPFFIVGEVTKGRQLGRVIGFPTLNIYPPGEKFLPENGVYETRTLLGGVWMAGVTNIGLCPTVSDCAKNSVETHIPDLQAKPDEMYGRQIKVELLRFIRPERHFDTIEELQSQIKTDIEGILQ